MVFGASRDAGLDGTIVIISIADLVISIAFAGLDVNVSFLRILRMLRVLRVLRLMRSWRGLYRICMTFIKALPQMSNVLVLMLLCMTIFALLGMQLFGGQLGGSLEGGPPDTRHHFDYFGPAMISVFVLLTGTWCAPYLATCSPSFGFCPILGNMLPLDLAIGLRR